MHRTLSGLVFVLLLSGCVTSQPRPANWPADVAVTAVPQVEGTYATAGVLALIDDAAVAFYPVRLRAQGDGLAFEFTLADGSTKKVLRPCVLAEGWIELGGIGDGTNREGVLGYERHRFALRPDAAGGLIVRTNTKGVGIMLMIPVAASQSGWHRLERLTPGAPVATLMLSSADLDTVARAWQANFGQPVVVSLRANALGVRVNITARDPDDFRSKVIAALRAQGVEIRGGHPGVIFSSDKEGGGAGRRAGSLRWADEIRRREVAALPFDWMKQAQRVRARARHES